MGMTELPLDGVRVVDFGWVWAGPLATSFLADLGAQVIKVESRARLDNVRLMGRARFGEEPILGTEPRKLEGEDFELTPMYHNINRNKLCISLNLKHPAAATVAKRLVAKSDIVLENFTPHVLEAAGLDYPALREVKPDIIMISMTTGGQDGALTNMRSYAPSLTSLSGLESTVGYEGEGVMGTLTFGLGDPNGAVHAVFAILTALYHRRKTGQGQYIDMAQLEGMIALLGEPLLDYQMNGRVPGPTGNRHPRMAPYGNYPCKGEDRWVSIAVKTEEEWRAFCQVTGRKDWVEDERFSSLEKRQANGELLDRLIAEWTQERTPYQAAAELQRAGVAGAPVLDVEEQYRDPHIRVRGLHTTCTHPMFGEETLLNIPWKLSRTPASIRSPAPMLGQHNRYVLGEILKMSEEEIDRLVEEGAVY
jgi:benzylsuccinate CoA-transferase BbsF subunit